MNNSKIMRDLIRLCETQQQEFPFMKDFLGHKVEPVSDDDIDYVQNWREILEYPDPNSSVSEEEQVRRALEASDAEKVVLHNGEVVYVTNDDVIEFDENTVTASIKNKLEWVNDADVDTYYPNHEQKFNDDFWEFSISSLSCNHSGSC